MPALLSQIICVAAIVAISTLIVLTEKNDTDCSKTQKDK